MSHLPRCARASIRGRDWREYIRIRTEKFREGTLIKLDIHRTEKMNIESTNALKKRIECHSKYAKKELNDWIFEVVKPQSGEFILDLGCGTGKQLIPLAQIIGPKGKVVGIDISKDALVEVASKTSRLSNITRIHADKDDCLDLLPCYAYKYTLIHSSYAIYYSKEPASLIQSLHKYLCEGGRLFVCGCDKGNNNELIRLLNKISSIKIPKMEPFISYDDIKRALQPYSSYVLHRFKNPVIFPSVESVLEYWRNHILYKKELEQPFSDLLKEHYDNDKHLVVYRKVLGVLAYA